MFDCTASLPDALFQIAFRHRNIPVPEVTLNFIDACAVVASSCAPECFQLYNFTESGSLNAFRNAV
jgi:hypothetical protein